MIRQSDCFFRRRRQSLHPYVYGMNNPLIYVDPSGKSEPLPIVKTENG